MEKRGEGRARKKRRGIEEKTKKMTVEVEERIRRTGRWKEGYMGYTSLPPVVPRGVNCGQPTVTVCNGGLMRCQLGQARTSPRGSQREVAVKGKITLITFKLSDYIKRDRYSIRTVF